MQPIFLFNKLMKRSTVFKDGLRCKKNIKHMKWLIFFSGNINEENLQ